MIVNILDVLKVVGMFVLLFCVMLGTFGAQFQSGGTQFFLYKVTGGGATRYYTEFDFGCADIDRNFEAALVFALFAWFTVIAGTAVAVLALIKKDLIPSIVGLILAGITWFLLLLAWCLVAALYNEGYCGGGGFKNGSGYVYGFAFLIISWLCATWIAFEVLKLLNLLPTETQNIDTTNATIAGTKTTETTTTTTAVV